MGGLGVTILYLPPWGPVRDHFIPAAVELDSSWTLPGRIGINPDDATGRVRLPDTSWTLPGHFRTLLAAWRLSSKRRSYPRVEQGGSLHTLLRTVACGGKREVIATSPCSGLG